MKSNRIFNRNDKIADALITFVASILTDVLYDILDKEHFKIQIENAITKIIKVSEHNIAYKILLFHKYLYFLRHSSYRMQFRFYLIS